MAEGGLRLRAVAVLQAVPPGRIAAVAAVLGLVGVGALAASYGLAQINEPASGLLSFDEASVKYANAYGVLDSDRDGLSDAMENFHVGSDPTKWNTSGTPLPDSWLAKHGYPVRDPTIAFQRMNAVPTKLPAAYGGQWPQEFHLTLLEVYSYGRPATWNESADGPHSNGLDPRKADANNDGLPEAFLIFHGLPPLNTTASSRPAGPEGLTVKEAFEAGTDPTAVDTDRDGISDAEEMLGPANPAGKKRFAPTNPRRWDTAGAGVCDGYLQMHGLDPNDAESARGDPDRDGATTAAEFNWTLVKSGDAACKQKSGVSPNDAHSGNSSIPDGWHLRYGLNPLDPDIDRKPLQGADSDPHASIGCAAPTGNLTLTVREEYSFGRPSQWREADRGPWWGGTNPALLDTDGDGFGDAWEQRGCILAVGLDFGRTRTANHTATSNPTAIDSDDDGLSDAFEYSLDPPADPSRRDTDFDGLTDLQEVALDLGLNWSRADSAGDYMRDGERLALLQDRVSSYAREATYEYPGPPLAARKWSDWLQDLPGAGPLLTAGRPADPPNLLAPGADADEDGEKNILDDDIDGDELLNGWEFTPSRYRFSQWGTGVFPQGRSFTDPLNPDTDGDELADGWEVRYGAPHFAAGTYDPNPAKWDTDNDGQPDGREDSDGDGIKWNAYQDLGGFIDRRENQFVFTNLLEQQFQTHPNKSSTDNDTLQDGWKAFWGTIYATLGASSPTPPGLIYPGSPGPLQVPPGAPRPAFGKAQGDVGTLQAASSFSYDRFITSTSQRRAWETIQRQSEGAFDPSQPGGVQQVYELRGTIPFSFADSQATGSNPYLLDTDGDAMPDWWEDLQARRLTPDARAPTCRATGGPDVLMPDADQDPDSDSVLNLAEFVGQTDPLCPDSDFGGLADGSEADFQLDATNPTDDRTILDSAMDSDGDGVADYLELAGVRNFPGLPPETLIRTSPDLPDTDGDGLLDGNSLPDPASAGWPLQDSRVQRFLDLGIAYHRNADGKFFFFGERQNGGDPRNGDDRGVGIPLGWLLSHGIAPEARYMAAYEFARPTWWDESVHGPWWGGANPNWDTDAADLARELDPDRDGLRDRDGAELFEDPFPGANRLNELRAIDASIHGFDIPAATVPPSPELNRTSQRLLGQAFLNPRMIGQSFVSRERLQQSPVVRQPACLDVIDLGFQQSVHKGQVVQASGKVTDCHGVSLPSMTVEVRIGSPEQVFGAAVTDSAGQFVVSYNISRQHSLEVTGGVFKGQTDGTVQWLTDSAGVRPGAGQIILQSYASAATSGPAYHSERMAFPIVVKSASSLTITAPTEAKTGDTFEVRIASRDSGGSPLQDPVEVTWLSTVHRRTPNPEGIVTLPLGSTHAAAGDKQISVRNFPESDHVSFGEASTSIRLLQPLTVHLDRIDSVDAGHVLEVKGRVVGANGQAIPQASVRLNLSIPDSSGVIVNASGDGRFRAHLQIPADASKGTLVLTGVVDKTARAGTAQASILIPVRSVARIASLASGVIVLGQSAIASGVLVEPDGAPVANAAIRVQLHDEVQDVTTDAQGRFSAAFAKDLPLRPLLQTVIFAGDNAHTPIQVDIERQVQTATRIGAPGGTVARGANATMLAQLVDAQGDPIAGAELELRWGDERPMSAITNQHGWASAVRTPRETDLLGDVTVRARFGGSHDNTQLAAAGLTTWEIQAQARIILPQGTLELGRPAPDGRVIDDGTGQPIVGMQVFVKVLGNESSATTNADGRFTVLGPTNRTGEPKAVHIIARTPAMLGYASREEASDILLRSPTEIAVKLPPAFVVGQPANLLFGIMDGMGHAVTEGMAIASSNQKTLGGAEPAGSWTALQVEFPVETAPGQHVLRIVYEGSDSYSTSWVDVDVKVLNPAALDLKLEPGEAGSLSEITVQAESNGQPLAFSRVMLDIDGASSQSAVTDAKGRATFLVPQGTDLASFVARYEGDSSTAPAIKQGTLVAAPPPSPLQPFMTWTTWVMIAASILLAGTGAFVYRVRRHPLMPAFRNAMRSLHGANPIEQRILSAFQQLDHAAVAYGFLDAPARTPRMLEAAYENLPLQARRPLTALVTLFEQARYGTDPMTTGHLQQAESSLELILKALRQSNPFNRPVGTVPA